MIRIYYFLKSLLVSKDTNLKTSLKNPKEVMVLLIILWAISVIFLDHLLPKYYQHFFLILIVLAYGWMRYDSGDWKYWYRKREGYYEK